MYDTEHSIYDCIIYMKYGLIFSTGHCSPRCGTSFQVQGVYRETALRRGRDYAEGRHVALMYVKRIVIKFFWTIV